MKKLQTLFSILLIATIILSGCKNGANHTIQNTVTAPMDASIPAESSDATLTGQEDTTSPLLVNLELQLPDSIERKPLSSTREYFYKDGEIVGGIELLDIASQMDSMDLDAYAELALSVTKTAYDRDYDYMAESSSDCHAMVSLISHDGKEFYHYFFKGTEIGYDLWIDNNVLDARDMRSYLKTLHSDDIYNPQDHMTTNAEVPLLNLRVTLPDGITYQPVRTTRSLFYSGETVVGGVEQIDVSADLDALGTAATTLMQELYGGDFDYISMDLESENIIASIATQQGDSRFVHYIITVGTECYDVWADPMLIMEEDLLEITYSCKY